MARKLRRLLTIAVALFAGGGGGLWWWSARAADLDSMERIVRTRFPRVRQITTAELDLWFRSHRPRPVLLDIREPAEFAISHIGSARNIPPDGSIEKLKDIPKNAPIVTYCSVGWRSSAFAQRLTEAGYTDVQNLEGSIFRWANEDRPLRQSGKPAEKVHPYSPYWSRLVKPERRASLKE